ncbi:hypothetical protein [Leptolyngbya sp. Heron Island J]|uniref:hypothetical protein n=1 Tax=Leptolyngbya sp. Heron Island J TaxID=1385935 RepID=UPI0012680564|nr:hypothetical protein [Leptolyngbya sp. Heron Island J]
MVSWPQVSWPKLLSVSVGCIGLWFSSSSWGLAQPISDPPVPSSHQPLAPVATPAVNIDQILLPPADDVPEEILRTEIIFEARSPLDGTTLSPADYAQLQADLAASQTTPTLNLSPEYDFILLLLQLRRAFKPVIPF